MTQNDRNHLFTRDYTSANMEGEGLNNRSDQQIQSATFMLDVITSGPQDGTVGGSSPFDSSRDVKPTSLVTTRRTEEEHRPMNQHNEQQHNEPSKVRCVR